MNKNKLNYLPCGCDAVCKDGLEGDKTSLSFLPSSVSSDISNAKLRPSACNSSMKSDPPFLQIHLKNNTIKSTK